MGWFGRERVCCNRYYEHEWIDVSSPGRRSVYAPHTDPDDWGWKERAIGGREGTAPVLCMPQVCTGCKQIQYRGSNI